MRIGNNSTTYTHYYNTGQYASNIDANIYNVAQPLKTDNNDQLDKIQKKQGIQECKTCKSRKYQDKSDDPGVSFKSATTLSPETARSAVVSHEYEHVRNEQFNAKQSGREVLYQYVQIYTDVCPECGKVYVAGGKTTTATGSEKKAGSYQPGQILDMFV